MRRSAWNQKQDWSEEDELEHAAILLRRCLGIRLDLEFDVEIRSDRFLTNTKTIEIRRRSLERVSYQ